MKILVWIVSAINIYFGLNNFLNAIHVLHTAKYALTTTWLFAILFLGLGGGAIYFLLTDGDAMHALMIAIGPWVLAVAVLFIAMVTGNQQ